MHVQTLSATDNIVPLGEVNTLVDTRNSIVLMNEYIKQPHKAYIAPRTPVTTFNNSLSVKQNSKAEFNIVVLFNTYVVGIINNKYK